MQRVLIVGSCGAGKSTLAFRLQQKIGLPLFHMDRLHWLPGWVENTKEELFANVETVIQDDRWILEGNYAGSLHLRLPRADTVIWLDRNRWVCTWRIFKRVWQFRGTNRPDMTEGCNERVNWEFFHYTFTFPEHGAPRLKRKLEQYGQNCQIIRLTSDKEVEDWLASITQLDGA